MDSIALTGIRATSRGSAGQPGFTYEVDARLYLDMNAAVGEDDLTQTVDYVQIARRIVSLIRSLDVYLLETVASKIADAILLSHQVVRVKVQVHRLDAGRETGLDIGGVSACIEREASPEHVLSQASVEAGLAYEHSQQARSRQNHPAAASAPSNQAADAEEPQQEESGLHRAVIAMSGNIGPVEDAMRTAVVSLDGIPGGQILGISALYRLRSDQDSENLCSVVLVQTTLGPIDLLSALRMIESAHGRSHSLNLASYPLALNLIDFDGCQWSLEDMIQRIQSWQWAIDLDDQLRLPKPQAWQQASVLKPWLDVDPSANLCGPHGGPVDQLLEAAPDRDQVELVSDSWILGGSV